MDLSSYLDASGRDGALSGGVRMVPVQAASGTLRVWAKRVGNDPRIRLFLLHGGPAQTCRERGASLDLGVQRGRPGRAEERNEPCGSC